MPTAKMISIARIVRGELLPEAWFRDTEVVELASELRKGRALRPLHVADGAMFELLADELSWRAARAAGRSEVPAIVHAGTGHELLRVAFREHMKSSKTPDPFASAELAERLKREGSTQSDIGDLVGLGNTDVSHLIRLNRKLAPQVKKAIRRGSIKQGHGRLLARLPHDQQVVLLGEIAAHRWSVRRLEIELRGGGVPSSEKPADVARLEDELTEAVGNPVVVDYAADGSGEVRVKFHSLDEAEGVFARLRHRPPPSEFL